MRMSYKHVLVATVEAAEAIFVTPTNIVDYVNHYRDNDNDAMSTFLEALQRSYQHVSFPPSVTAQNSCMYIYTPTTSR